MLGGADCSTVRRLHPVITAHDEYTLCLVTMVWIVSKYLPFGQGEWQEFYVQRN